MKVRMKASISGTRNGQPWPPRGAVAELPDDEAEQLLWLDLAEPAEPAADRLARTLERARR